MLTASRLRCGAHGQCCNPDLHSIDHDATCCKSTPWDGSTCQTLYLPMLGNYYLTLNCPLRWVGNSYLQHLAQKCMWGVGAGETTSAIVTAHVWQCAMGHTHRQHTTCTDLHELYPPQEVTHTAHEGAQRQMNCAVGLWTLRARSSYKVQCWGERFYSSCYLGKWI